MASDTSSLDSRFYSDTEEDRVENESGSYPPLENENASAIAIASQPGSEHQASSEELGISGIFASLGNLPFIGPGFLSQPAPLGKGSSFVVTREVYSKNDDENPFYVAVKRVRVRERSHEQLRRTYRSVVREAQTLNHQPLKGHGCIMRALGYGWTSSSFHAGDPYLVVEYSDHGTLRAYMDRLGFRPDEGRELALDIAIGLRLLHENKLIHGDVKLENVLVFDGGEYNFDRLIAKLADFGNTISEEDIAQNSARLVGTAMYNAPEIELRKSRGTDEVPQTFDTLTKSEVYSFGLALWEIIKLDRFMEWSWYNGVNKQSELTFLQNLQDTEKDGLLTRAIDWFEGRQKKVFIKSHQREIFPIVNETLKRCLRDDPKERGSMVEVVRCLAQGTRCVLKTFPPLYPKSLADSTASDDRPRFPRTTRRILIPDPPKTSRVKLPIGVYEKTPKVRLSTDEEAAAAPNPPKNFRRLNAAENPAFDVHTLATLRGETQPMGSEEFLAANIDVFEASLKTLPPWRVQVAIFNELRRESQIKKDPAKNSNAFLQLCACYHLGFGTNRSSEQTLACLGKSSSINLVAAALKSKVVEALVGNRAGEVPEDETQYRSPAHEQPITNDMESFSSQFHRYQSHAGTQIAAAIKRNEDPSKIAGILPSAVRGVRNFWLCCPPFLEFMSKSASSFRDILNSKFYPQGDLAPCLTLACRYGQFDAAVTLAASITEFPNSFEEPNPLHWLISFKEDEALTLARLLINGSPTSLSRNGICAKLIDSEVEETMSFPEHAMELFGTPLHWAVRAGNLALVQELVRLGANVNVRWDAGRIYHFEPRQIHAPSLSPIDLATVFHYPRIVNFLIEEGAETFGGEWLKEHSIFHLVGHSTHPFARFVIHGRDHGEALKETVRIILKHGIDINKRTGGTELALTPLSWALRHLNNEEYIVDELLRNGALMPSESEEGSNPAILIVLASTDSPSATWKLSRIIHLVDDINQRDQYGRSALHYCAIAGSVEMAEILYSRGGLDVDARATGCHGGTALTFAAMFGNAKMVAWLVGKGARIDLADAADTTPLEQAVISRNLDAVTVLLDRGADCLFGRAAEGEDIPKQSILHAAVMGATERSRTSLILHPTMDAEKFESQFRETTSTYFADRNEYKTVHVLITYWIENDLGLEEELESLRKIFEDDYHFAVTTFPIPLEGSQRRLNTEISNFIDKWSQELDSLVIIYYAGHCFRSEKGEACWAAFEKGDPTLLLLDLSPEDLEEALHDDGAIATGAVESINLRQMLLQMAAIPDDLGIPREKIAFTDREHRFRAGKISCKSVLVELFSYEVDERTEEPTGAALDQVKKITALLRQPKRTSFHILPCVGYVQDKMDRKLGLVFETPHHRELNGPPTMLVDLYKHKPYISLSDRLRLAHALAVAVENFHRVGWVHKELRSNNVCFLSPRKEEDHARSPADDLDLSSPWLFGFDYARATDAGTRLDEDQSLENNVYRHPDRWGRPNVKFTKVHDVYSLQGVVLFEVANWKDVRSVIKLGKHISTSDVRKGIDKKCSEKLPFMVGQVFTNAIKACLDFETPTQGKNEYEVQRHFQEEILSPLEKAVGRI
ncbi:hypothetical protein SLS56_004113 [Neofusicoccum ribis]|uniref:Protein kinase domain-containing protein n=1 Tax=Neofusicoccum ribis TaxID=45134 RepID=A0ABR3SXZ3_9PEZI